MKLKNKKTGEIVEFHYLQSDYISPLVLTVMRNGKPVMIKYNSIAELNADWEDVIEEPKEYWCIRENGVVGKRPYPIGIECVEQENREEMREIGNYFETKEEAEKAVEKLKAWKLLKDMGMKIEGIRYRNNKNYIEWSISRKLEMTEVFNDALHLLFGGEE